MKKILFLTILGIAIFSACNNDETTPCTTSNSGIYGTWDWVQSTHYFTGNGPVVKDPSTEGYTRSIEITTNTAYFYKNGNLEDSTNYSIINDQIAFDNGGTYYYSEDSCVLILDLSYVDGPKEEYKCACDEED